MGTEWGFISPETGDFIGVSEEGMRKRWSARERPSALDVDRLAEAMVEYADGRSRLVIPVNRMREAVRAILARLTEPDAGEGTERPHWRSLEYHDWHRNRGIQYTGYCRVCAPTPDTTEATLDHIAWAQAIRSEHEATHGEAEQCGSECIVLGLTEFDEEPA